MWKQMRDDDFDQMAIKIVIVGNGVVGKSSMIQRYCNGIFTNEYKKTIGVDFLERFVRVGDTDVRLMLWDTAGQEEFDALTKAYYRGAQGCVVAFSTTDRASFDAVEKWKKKVEYECGDIPMALVQNKADLLEQRSMTSDEVDQKSRQLQMRVFLTSAKNNVNIDEDSLDEEDPYEAEPLNCGKTNQELSYSLLPNNPLFGGSHSPSKKYLKKKNKSKKSKHFQLAPAQRPPPPPLDYPPLGNPLLRHFRYERRFQLIPHNRGVGHAGPPTILLHHHSPWQPYYGTATAYNQQQHRQHHHKRRSKTCWIL